MRLLLCAVILAACTRSETPVTRPVVGIAIVDTAGTWCAEFPAGAASQIREGTNATIIFAGDSGTVSRPVRIGTARSAQCAAAFPQPRWDSYSAFDLVPLDSVVSSSIGLILSRELNVTRTGGATDADIDGDGVPETIRRCAADEGEHFTVWSGNPPRRLWHEYFDWGAIVDPTCRAGENGRDSPADSP